MIEQLNSLPLRKKVGQLFFIGIAGAEIDFATLELLDEVSPGGICLFTRNIRETGQTRKLLDDLRQTLPVAPFLSLDQEGGLVDRLRRILTPMPAANKIKSAMDASRLARLIAESVRILGFNMDFAPVVDVVDDDREQAGNGLYSRTFGRSSEDVVELAGEFLTTLQENGVIGCVKHFPGLGAAMVDSHEELPLVEIAEDELLSSDLRPYQELFANGEVRLVMSAHAAFPNSRLQERDENGKLLPSSLSQNFITQFLRNELGYDGLAITDDLEMGAIMKNYGVGTACVMAVEAGQDLLAICAAPANIREGFNAVLAAVESGKISEERLDYTLLRIAALKSQLSEPLPFDTARLAAISAEITEFNTYLNR